MKLAQITPFVPCTALKKQVEFYTGTLDFKVGFQAENYAFLRRDDVAVRLIEVDADVDLSEPNRENSFYIDVEDIDELFETMRPALERLPQKRVRKPFDQDYGQREFHVIDEDCTLIFFGEPIRSPRR